MTILPKTDADYKRLTVLNSIAIIVIAAALLIF